ncbi:MAG: hypothetical protein ACYDA1_00100 [Vulcanimicrobiaceae bacterium]
MEPAPPESVGIIDDDADYRNTISYIVEQQGLKAVKIDHLDPANYLEEIVRETTFVLCDLRLKPMTAERGADIVASLTERKFPAVLFSQQLEDDIPEFRDKIDKIPKMFTRDEIYETADFRQLIRQVRNSLAHVPLTSKAYRSLARIESREGFRRIEVVVPAWSSRSFEISLDCFPEPVRDDLVPDAHLYVSINLHAERQEEVFLHFLEIAPTPGDDGDLA